MVAGDGHHPDPCLVQTKEGYEHHGIGFGWRGPVLVEVPRHEHRVDGLIAGDPHDLVERRGELLVPRPSSDGLADMPVCRVQEPQSAHSPRNGRNGSPPEGAASSARVAHDGKGKRIWSGMGMCGCWRIIDPGLRMEARDRVTAGRNPYSLRAASAVSSLPTTRNALLAMIRRSTSLAVCSAPTRIIPSERPRSATSSRTSLMGLHPSRGA